MTTNPKAKKFRIRRSAPTAADTIRRASAEQATGAAGKGGLPPGTPDDQLFAPSDGDDGFGAAPFPNSAAALAAGKAQAKPTDASTDPSTDAPKPSVEEAIEAIRKEGLTGRQLRMARRVAQKHGLTPASDFDAVRMLREKGIDPLKRANSLDLVVSGPPPGQEGASAQVPQTVPKPQLPTTEVVTEDTRAREIIEMQRDIVRRRRRKMIQLMTRLAFFVLLPTFIAGWYFFKIATPMYSTRTEFVIQQAQPAMGASSGLSSLFSGTSFATSQDSIAVQGYLGSIDAMLRLDKDLGFIKHFSQPDIDPLHRLPPDASKQDAYRLYKKKVKISYDPTEGIIKMEVIAADPEMAKLFSERLISYAEEQVDNLTQRLREDQMRGALESYKEAEQKMLAAQQRVLELQEQLGVLDPVVESQALMTQITTFETQLQEKKLQLQQLLDNPKPNRARVEGIQGDIRRLENLIAELRAQLTESRPSSASLATMTGQLRLAETDLQTRQLMMTQALQQMETARIEANRQTRYLSMAVSPVAPDEPSYPRAFESTLLAFLIFGGIYLMISLTASILREQVSA